MPSNFKLILVFSCLALGGCIGAKKSPQEKFYLEKYKNRADPGNRLISAGATRTVEQTPDQRFILKEYYFETGQKTLEMSYSDRSLNIPEGRASEWFDNGAKWKEGQYRGGKKEGEWKFYSFLQNGKLSYYGPYVNGLQEGVWTDLDSLGRKTGEIWYKAGEKTGQARYFNADGTEKPAAPAAPADTLTMEVPPAFPCDPNLKADPGKCGERSLMKFLSATIRYPAAAREKEISGTALVQFVVDKDGSIVQPTFLRGVSDDIKAECLRMIKLMPRWTPGTVNGKPVKVRYTLPVRFRLE